MVYSPDNEIFSVKKLQAKRFLQIWSPLGPTNHPKKHQKKAHGYKHVFWAVLPPSAPFFNVFYLNDALQTPKSPKLIIL